MATAHDALRVASFTYDDEAYSHLCDVITDVFKNASQALSPGYLVEHVHGPGSTMIHEPDAKFLTFVSIFLNETREEMKGIVGNRGPIPVLIGVEQSGDEGSGISEAYPVPCVQDMTMRQLAEQAFAVWLFRKDNLIARRIAQKAAIEVQTHHFVRILSHKDTPHPEFDVLEGHAMEVPDVAEYVCEILDRISLMHGATPEDLQNAASRHHDWTNDGVGIVHQYLVAVEKDWRSYVDCAILIPHVYDVIVYKGPDYSDEDIIYRRNLP